MPHGGARPNSGPKPGTIYKPTLEKQAMRVVIQEFVREHLQEILEAQKDRAVGLSYEGEDGKVYKDKPDPVSAKLLIEHANGKAPESIELSGPGGEPIQVKWES